jgi:predicted nucleotidyltransferase
MTAELKTSAGLSPTREWALGKLRQMINDALGNRRAEVWLFGSCARGKILQHSDIDIAILPQDELPSGFFSDLAESVEESSIPYDVDIVDLRGAAPTLIDEVRREGVKWKG